MEVNLLVRDIFISDILFMLIMKCKHRLEVFLQSNFEFMENKICKMIYTKINIINIFLPIYLNCSHAPIPHKR